MRRLNDSEGRAYRARVEPDDPDYAAMVAQPTMNAIVAMPKEYRECVHEFGYVDVYRAWKRGWSAERIRKSVIDGRFEFMP